MDLNIYVEKLYQAWIKYKGVRILVGYDDTIKPYNTASEALCKDIINTLIEAQELGATVVLWTCRSGSRLKEAVNYCKSVGLEQALTTLKLALYKYKKFVYEINEKQRLQS